MKKIFKMLAVSLLMLSLTMSFSIVNALNESNDKGVVFSASLNKSTVTKSDSDQTVVLTLSANKLFTTESLELYYKIDAPITLNSITGDEINILESDYGTERVMWDCVPDTVTTNTVCYFNLTVPANTEPGTYDIEIYDICLSENYGEEWESTAKATATLTVADEGSDVNTAEISVSAAEVVVDDIVYVTVKSGTSFAAAELAVTYSPGLFEYVEASSILNGAVVVDDTEEFLDLVDHGETQNSGIAYVIAFRAILDGDAKFSLDSCAFGKIENAATQDLTAAEITVKEANVTIRKKSHAVTLPDILVGNSAVNDSEDYTFSVANKYYDYTVSATIDGVDTEVAINADGSYTVKDVKGELVITAQRTPKEYTVTFTTETSVMLPENTSVKYGTDYTFTLPSQEHYATTITSAKYNSGETIDYSISGGTVTVKGTDIINNIIFVIDQTLADSVVTVEGNGVSDVTYTPYATPGEDYSITITKDTLYDYAVSAKVNNSEVSVGVNDNVYTINGDDVELGGIVITVEKTVRTDTVNVYKYVQLDSKAVYLVVNSTDNGTILDGKGYTFRGVEMFWSEKYSAYCTLVIEESLEKDDITGADLAVVKGDTLSIDYGMDVNKSGRVDANDAQFTYNIYNAYYGSFTADVTVEKLLRADTNGDYTVSVLDASAIVNNILYPLQ